MRILVLSIITFLLISNYLVVSGPRAQTVSNSVRETQPLELRLISEKHIYKRNDEIHLNAMVINTSDQDIFVYGNLEWGYSASLTLCLRDAGGKAVQPKFIADSITHLTDDKSQFVKLVPYHFLGTYYVASTDDLNIHRPGKYSIFIEYHSPIASSRADVSPFFGKEKGVIRSNPISIEVQ